jgi:hypothetical protein
MVDQADKIKACVVLIHGTWAKDTKWTEPSSVLARTLDTVLGKGTIIERFKWSGRNSHSARLRAGTELAGLLNALSKRYPEAPCYLIAHSHGGNVAAYALREKPVQDYVAGMICLATPFLDCRRRRLEFAATIVAATIFACLALFMLFGLLTDALQDDSSTNFTWLRMGSLFVLIILFEMLRRFVIKPLGRWATDRQRRIMGRLELPEAPITRLLCLAPTEDEARRFLTFLQGIAEFPHRLWSAKAFVIVWLVTFSVMLIVMLPEIFPNWPPDLTSDPIMAAIALVFSAFAAFVVLFVGQVSLQALMLAIPRIIRSHPLGFGWEGPMVPWFVRIDVSETPQSFAHCEFREYQVPGSGLRHSRIYQDEACVTDIASWIGSTMGKQLAH